MSRTASDRDEIQRMTAKERMETPGRNRFQPVFPYVAAISPAARGIDGREWPWDRTFLDVRANKAGHGDRLPGRVGSLPAGASPYGCLDLSGNVEEWLLAGEDETALATGGHSASESKATRAFARQERRKTEFSVRTGFRCARPHRP